jgi:hypothetical protein
VRNDPLEASTTAVITLAVAGTIVPRPTLNENGRRGGVRADTRWPVPQPAPVTSTTTAAQAGIAERSTRRRYASFVTIR